MRLTRTGASQTAAAWAQNWASSARLSRPRTLCGRSSMSARIRPAWDAEIPVPPGSAAIMACVHSGRSSGGTEVAAATMASRPVPRASQGGHAAAGEPAPPGPDSALRAAQLRGDPRVRPAGMGQQQTGHANQALDTACTLYLASPGAQPAEPVKDLRGAAPVAVLRSVNLKWPCDRRTECCANREFPQPAM